jgi:soluble lytic murein transglycosylase-like protein
MAFTPQMMNAFQTYGAHSGVTPGLLMAMAKTESAGDPQAVSSKGAQGLMQFMPDAARDYRVDVTDPISSIQGAARYMSYLLKRYGGNRRLALAAYNAGPGKVDAYQGEPPYATPYVNKVLSTLARLSPGSE